MSTVTDIIFDGKDHYITSKYGYRILNGKTSFHNGTDYGTNLKNLPLYAIAQGTVHSKGYEAKGAGYYIWIYYPRLAVLVGYYHMKEATLLSENQVVNEGTLVGYTGTTGNSTGIHLHLGIKNKSTGEYYDPEIYAQINFCAVPVEPVGTPVVRNAAVNQIEVRTDSLRARKRPELTDAVIIGYIIKGIYNVSASRDMRHEQSNGYLWYEVEPDIWIAYSENWSEYYGANISNQLLTDETELVTKLQNQNAELKRQNAGQTAALKAIQAIVNETVA